jgi:uncharacterized protein YcfL
MKKGLVAISFLTALLFTGCSSDTKESLQQEFAQLLVDCGTGKLSATECKEKGTDLKERIEEFNRKNR